MIILLLAVTGLAFGSFITAFAWRLHERKNFITGRSQCEHCHHTLSPLDLIPVVSWLLLKGECRYCHAKIGWQFPAIELGTAILFVGSYIAWPGIIHDWLSAGSFLIWLIYLVLLVTLVVYDLRWMLLPDTIVWPLVLLGLADAALRIAQQPGATVYTYAEHVLLGALTLGGFYWVLHTVSKGKWVGYGDVKLGLFMGIVLGWQQAILALFLANLAGFMAVLPGLVSGRLTPKSHIPFGPFLIVGFILSGLFGSHLIAAYIDFLLFH